MVCMFLPAPSKWSYFSINMSPFVSLSRTSDLEYTGFPVLRYSKSAYSFLIFAAIEVVSPT